MKETYNPAEQVDRGDKIEFKKYLLDNPYYCLDILGLEPTEENIDQYIEQNPNLFVSERRLNKMLGKYSRRRL